MRDRWPLSLILLVACGGDPAPAPAPARVAPPAPTTPTSTVEPVPLAVPSVAPPPAPAPSGPVVLGPPPIVFGDTHYIEGESDDDDPPTTIFVAEPPRPQPATARIGYVTLHSLTWDIRVIEEVASPYERASIVGPRGVCVGRVRRARRLHAVDSQADVHESPGERRGYTFLGLEVASCTNGDTGVAGAPVTVRSLHADDMTVVARPELVAMVRPFEERFGYGEPLDATLFRMLELPDRGLTVVVGEIAWLVRNGEVLVERYRGWPRLLIEAGPRTIFTMTSPSESWSSALEHFAPLLPDGRQRAMCEVADASGTPLNIRREPNGSAEVLLMLPNGEIREAIEERGAWLRLATTPPGWAHRGGLTCDRYPTSP